MYCCSPIAPTASMMFSQTPTHMIISDYPRPYFFVCAIWYESFLLIKRSMKSSIYYDGAECRWSKYLFRVCPRVHSLCAGHFWYYTTIINNVKTTAVYCEYSQNTRRSTINPKDREKHFEHIIALLLAVLRHPEACTWGPIRNQDVHWVY